MPPSAARPPRLSRRALLRLALGGAGLAMVPTLAGCRDTSAARRAVAQSEPPLGPPDANGVRLPPGFSSRIVARAGAAPVAGGRYRWHGAPDGGACFATPDGGWIYVSNSELPDRTGGVGALRFAADGTVIDAYPICRGTTLNCAGGATPWGTWLTCEEFPGGQVWECDPFGERPAVPRPALGIFQHEAVVVDPGTRRLYLTEDTYTGRFYRFTPGDVLPSGAYDLARGTLEVAAVDADERVTWHLIADPIARQTMTAAQVPASTPFRGGEGITILDGVVYFTTKFDNRVWAYDPGAERLRVLYDDDAFDPPVLTGVDNIVAAPSGELLVAEDGGDMQLVWLDRAGIARPLLQVVGQHDSELAGPAFDPSGTRLYFSSQRGTSGTRTGGITYEVRGPFA